MKQYAVFVCLGLCLTATSASAQVVRNPAFDTDLNNWLTCYDNITSGQLTPGSATWDAAYGGSARLEVDGAPSVTGLCQPTCANLNGGDTVWADVHVTDMGNFATVGLVLGDDQGNGQNAVRNNVGAGDYRLEIIANKAYAQGTFYRIYLTAWPGACTSWVKTMGIGLSITEKDAGNIPTAHAALSVNPNPTTGRVSISLGLPRPCSGRLAVYDVAGNLIQKLDDRQFAAGQHDFAWTSRDASGYVVSPGTYFVRLTTDDGREQTTSVVVAR